MARHNDFQEIISGIFALIVLAMIGSVILKDSTESFFSIIINIILIIGFTAALIAVLRKLKDFF